MIRQYHKTLEIVDKSDLSGARAERHQFSMLQDGTGHLFGVERGWISRIFKKLERRGRKNPGCNVRGLSNLEPGDFLSPSWLGMLRTRAVRVSNRNHHQKSICPPSTTISVPRLIAVIILATLSEKKRRKLFFGISYH